MKTSEILFNLGLSKLYLKKPKEAFDCLLLSLRIYNNNPRLWLRVAEACIMHHKLQENDTNTKITKRKRKIFHDSSNASSRAIPAPTIEFASFCLSNCLKLLEDYETQILEIEDDDWKNVQYNICNPSFNMTPNSLNKLFASAYLNSSFVALELGDYINALKFSKSLSKCQNIPISYL